MLGEKVNITSEQYRQFLEVLAAEAEAEPKKREEPNRKAQKGEGTQQPSPSDGTPAK